MFLETYIGLDGYLWALVAKEHLTDSADTDKLVKKRTITYRYQHLVSIWMFLFLFCKYLNKNTWRTNELPLSETCEYPIFTLFCSNVASEAENKFTNILIKHVWDLQI